MEAVMKSEREIENNVRDRFDNSFDVPLSSSLAWRVLSDVERVVSYIPGLELTRVVDKEDYEGKIKVALGSANLSFALAGKFEQIDPIARTARLKVHGVADGGLGAADAIVSFRLVGPIGGGSTVFVNTDLTLTGPAARYGTSVSLIQHTAGDIMSQFAANLRAQLAKEKVSAN
jgi:uncharacterized protein